RSVALAATLAISGAAAQAATIATVDIVGDFEISPFGFGPFLGTTTSIENGAFDFQLLGPVDQPGDFVYGASLTVNDERIFFGSIDGPPDTSPLDFGATVLSLLPPPLVGIAGDIGTALLETGSFDATSILGSLSASVSNLSLAEDQVTGEFGLEFSSLFLPFLGEEVGSFELSLTIDDGVTPAPIPLPASAGFLLLALGGFAAMRRKAGAA
ncbi:MAG: VPLPA-CTERM sorting domain-containing protein, partial [Pseudomonadota bacterium]